MHPVRRWRLTRILLIASGLALAVGLTLFAIRDNISLFYTPSQLKDNPIENTLIRLGGMVVENSIVRAPNSLNVQFSLTDYHSTIIVDYTGILPDLFRQGQGIVTRGRLKSNGEFRAVEILAKHDANYMPAELRSSLKNAA